MISIDHDSPTLAYEQIRSQLSDLIRSGELKEDARLPSIRQLAGDLRVAPGTVARAYTELSEAGLVLTSRSGARVASAQSVSHDIRTAAALFVALARQQSLSIDDVIGVIRTNWAGRPPASSTAHIRTSIVET